MMSNNGGVAYESCCDRKQSLFWWVCKELLRRPLDLVVGIGCVWVARRPPGYAFVEFDDSRDAHEAIKELDGKNGWRVELSQNSKGGGGGHGCGGRGGRGGGEDSKCYECGEPGHFARECRMRIGSRGLGSGRRRSISSRRRRSPSYGGRTYKSV